MKKFKKLWIIFLVILQVGLPTFSSLLIVTETVYATENSISETTEKTKETEATDDATASSTSSSAKPATDKETTSSSVEPQVTDEITQEKNKESKSSSTTSENTEPENTTVTSDLNRADPFKLDVAIQSEGSTSIVPLTFRDSTDTGEVTANWKVLRNEGYDLSVNITGFPSGSAAGSRQVKITIPQGLLVPKVDLEAIESNSNVIGYSIEKETHVVVDQISNTLRKSTYWNSEDTSSKYVTGATIVVNLRPNSGAEGFNFHVLPNFEDNTTNSPNFWTGISNDSLTRNQPIVVDLVEDGEPVVQRILDDVRIPSKITYPVVIGNPSVSGSTTPGTQILDKVLSISIQPRVRNTTENSSQNAFYMGNTIYKAYVPYKDLGGGKYLSAKLETGEMEAWLDSIPGNNPRFINYSVDEKEDGRTIVTYFFVDSEKEYLLQSPTFRMCYSYPSEVDEKGNSFAAGDTILYTQDNLGQTFRNYKYNEDGSKEMVDSLVRELGESTAKITITNEDEFKFDFLAWPGRKENPIYSTVALEDSEAAVLLDYALITNKSPAKGEARVEYKIDTTDDWKYGVTTIQFWTVDSYYGGSKEASREYTYKFDFVLQKKGDKTGTQILKGKYNLKPIVDYQGIQISRDDGTKTPLLDYKGAEERYFYYVNREMLETGITDSLPNDFDLKDYYIKELSYDLDISAGDGREYVSGIGNRPKESGGQLYGHTFGQAGDSGTNSFSITPIESNKGDALQKSHTTRLIAASTTYDMTTFLKKSMTVKNTDGTTLATIADRVSVGDKVSVSASALACFYPYGLLSYSPEPVFIIRTPAAFDLDVGSIALKQAGVDGNLAYNISQPTVQVDGSKIYYVTPIASNGLGFYNEDRNEIGEEITINYDMTVNIATRGETIAYRELLFIADKKYKNGTGDSGSYRDYMATDIWGIADNADGHAAFYLHPDGPVKLMSTSSGNQFSTRQPVLDFDLGSSLNLDDDPSTEQTGGILDEDHDFTATFSMSNTKQSGYVGANGLFIFYIPIPKAGIESPEWIDEQLQEFSLSLTGPVEPDSTMGVIYEVGYTTAKDVKYNNGEDNFLGANGEATYGGYDSVKDNLDEVTMVKVIARRDPEKNAHIIPFGERMTAKVPLSYSQSNSDFEENTGGITAWTPYVVQRYTVGSATNEFSNLAPESSVRIRYRQKFEREIWAYNELDYPLSEQEGEKMNKEIDIKLPKFSKPFNLQIDELNEIDIFNMILNEKGKFGGANSDQSVSFGNENFGFDVGLNTNATHDLFEAHPDGDSQVNKTIGLGTTSNAGNKLTYKIYNGVNITETALERSITIRYRSIDKAGNITDDIDFEVKLVIRRRASLIEADNALVAGKEYRTFTNIENRMTTLQDGAFTAQFTYDTVLLKDVTLEAEKLYLEFGGTGLPPSDTILMKVQSKISKVDKTEVPPEYYYYKNDTPNSSKEIQLSEFIKMGTTNEQLTTAKISEHIEAAEQLSYLFIFDFANNKANKTVPTDTISLKYDVPNWDGENLEFTIDEIREIKNATNALEPSATYEQREPIEVNGKFTVNKIEENIVDAYNLGKSLSLSLKLYDKDSDTPFAPVSWPQGSMIQYGDKLITPTNVDGTLRFICYSSTDTIINRGGELPYDFKILTDLEPLDTGNYRIEVEVYKDLSQSHPLGGDKIADPGELDFSVTATSSGLRVSSEIANRLVYSSTGNIQSATINVDKAGVDRLTAVLQKKLGANYSDVPDEQVVLTADLPDQITTNQLSINFKESIGVDDNGEYRIVFKGYDKDDELLYETNWTFIICNPPN